MNSSTTEYNKRPRLHYLDGVRGVCAIFIALFHAQIFTGEYPQKYYVNRWLHPLSVIFGYGYLAVPVFIVLSGFCLAIPVVIKNEKKLSRGFAYYIGRRAKRILPAYYITLLMFIAIILLVPTMGRPSGTSWDSKIPLTWDSIVSHLFLVHNLSDKWRIKIDGPLWSVATEWHLYFLFPVLLFLWRTFNLSVAVFVAIVTSAILPLIFAPFKIMHFWFWGLFAIGVLGANIVFSPEKRWDTFRELPWRMIANSAALLLIPVFYINSRHPIGMQSFEMIIGLVTCIMIVHYSLTEIQGLSLPILYKVFNSKMLIGLGIFSYSFYLIHSPLLAMINIFTLHIPVSFNMRWLFMEFVAVPITVGLAYLFYLVAEKRFMLNS